MNTKELAIFVIENVGSEENVIKVVHCATRLRFTLKDRSEVNKEALQRNDDVLAVVESGGQFQVVIGGKVADVYQEIMRQTNLSQVASASADKSQEKVGVISKVFDIISGTFSPLIPLLAGCGLLKALLTLCITFGWMVKESGLYISLSATGNAIFYFLPVFVGFTLANKLNANGYIGAVIGAALLEPNYTNLLVKGASVVDIFGIPVIPVSYANSVFPIFIAVIAFSFLEKLLKKIILKDLQFLLVPLVSLVVIVPLSFLAFGPFGTYLGAGIANGIEVLLSFSPILTGAVLGSGYMFLVIFGLHWGIVPITLQNLQNGGDPLGPMKAGPTFAQMGVAAGVFLKTKDKKLKAIAGPAAITGMMAGVTEPILYGIVLKYRRTIPYIVISGAIGGALGASLGVELKTYSFYSMLSIPAFAPISMHVLSVSASFIIALALTYFFGYESKATVNKHQTTENISDLKNEVNDNSNETIYLPVQGKRVPLTDVNDEVFSSGAIGKGIAIEPIEGMVTSPVNGVVTTVFPTGHAIGITSASGAEVLIHVGLNTVNLQGKYFNPIIKTGDFVQVGDKLVEFDIEKIREAGFDLTTPIIVTNTDHYLDVIPHTLSNTQEVLTLIKKQDQRHIS
ncbi:beta-glucoside-specific PTS transporter subunit IIABC [Peribacillus sp. FSL M8-0224]|uniref:beta-glucoside-specific PTS transporter subunit IIABC n=1 Tax=Peribacillus sp. FSL M8-0224 TaxID=2921568 RepID=UPI0030FA67F2|nr:beta-glucoside-specific PTS transporter subunit IIABC [Brevibacterium sp. PAMC21349]